MDIGSILRKYPKRREFILEILHDIQNHDPQHHLSDRSLLKVAQYVSLPLAQIYGIVGYYSLLSNEPRGKYIVQVCKSPVCNMMGSNSILHSLESIIIKHSPNQVESIFSIEEVECLGYCNESPCMMVNGRLHGNLTPDKIESIILDLKSAV
jgi:NADH:ubiquinone oxidoreductase subunit E